MSFFQSTSAVNSFTSIHHANRPRPSLPNDQPYLLHNPADSYTCIHPSQHHHRPPYTSPSIPTLQRSKVPIHSAMPQTQTYSTFSPSFPPHSPPSYIAPPSPPSYQPFPSPSDTTLLLAPPPPFYQATCLHASEGSTLLPLWSMGTGVNLRDKKLLGLRGAEGWGWMQRVRAVWARKEQQDGVAFVMEKILSSL
ncbi:hypothetical protein D1P53_000874 [Cryptococcus gattii VGV]|nr:hypothetical protein D1P53_000874 [Cryptococcus gattii VGV]